LTLILHGSTMDGREDGSFCTGAAALAVTGIQLVRSVPLAWSAPRPPWPEGPKSGVGAQAHDSPTGQTAGPVPDGSCAALGSARLPRPADLTPAGGPGRRASRALETVEKVLTN
jgi:hypothetical protein